MDLKQLKLEKLKRLKKLEYQKQPLKWLKEVFGEDPKQFEWSLHEGYEKHIWDGSKDPLSNAWKDVAKGTWTALSSATGTGKTFFISRLVFWFLDVFENALVVTTAPSEPQLKLQLWQEISNEFEKFKSKARKNSRLLTLSLHPEWFNKNPKFKYQRSHQAIGFTAGVGSDEDSAVKAQGLHRGNMLIICDEAPGMSSAIMTAFQNTCTGSNNVMLVLGNPDNENDELGKFSALPYVKSYRVSAYDHPNVVTKSELYKGTVTQVSIDRRMEKYGEQSIMFQSRVRGITPKDSDNTLIRKSWLDSAWEQSKSFTTTYNEDHTSFIGIDVANSENGDKAATSHGRGNRLHEIREFYCPNAAHIAHNIMLSDNEIVSKKYNQFFLPKMSDFEFNGQAIGVDAVGVGVSTINTFLEYNITPVSLQGGQWVDIIPKDSQGKLLYRFNNLRSQMFWELREDFRLGNLVLGIDSRMFEALCKELMAIRFVLNSGMICIESKEVIKKRLGGKSPNVADSCAYWNWVRKTFKKSEEFVYINLFGGVK